MGGYFVWDARGGAGGGSSVLLVAGGSGVVPLRAMLRHHRAAGSDVPVRLLYSAHGLDDVLWRDELVAPDADVRLPPWRRREHTLRPARDHGAVNPRAADFELDAGLTHLNHASFGVPTGAAVRRAEERRRAIERDTAVALGPELATGLREQAERLAREIGADPGSTALTAGSTEANAALATSSPLAPGDHVLLLDVEYPSVIRAWAVACERAGASLDLVRLPLPATRAATLAAVAAAHPATTVVVMSAITSSTAAALPVADVAALCHERGVALLVDAAHVVGHVRLDVRTSGADAVFGSLHKWLPVPRPVGFLWLAPRLRPVVRPAAVSLTWDSDDLVERFAWRGTWDPAPALGLADALAEWRAWHRAGELDGAATVADHLDAGLTAVGLRPTADAQLRPPRLRAFLADGAGLDELRRALDGAAVRAWTGTAPDGTTTLRVATHVYSEPADLDPLAAAVRAALRA